MPKTPSPPGQERKPARGKSAKRAIPTLQPLDTPAAPHSSAAADLHPNSIVTRASAFIEPHRRQAMVAEAAYFLAERRAFDPGHDVDDWLQAEQQIDRLLAGNGPTDRPN